MDIEEQFRANHREYNEIQTKTFTKWLNAKLRQDGLGSIIENVFVDLRDGKALIRLLRILYKNDPAIINLKAEKGGALRIHRINNVSAALQFLESRLNHQLYNIGAVDIVDGNSTSILGLLWIIILKLQIQSSLAGILDPQSLNPVKASGFDESKNNLLKWINQILKGRSLGVVDGFSCTTWKTGLHFANLLRSKNENLVPHYEQILQDVDRPGDNNEAWTRNLHLLFNIAEKSLNIPRLLDPIDLVQGKVEEKSLVTYISQFVDVLSSSTASNNNLNLIESESTSSLNKSSPSLAHNELAAKYDYVLKNFLSTIYRRKKRSITLSEIEAFCTECSQLIQKLDANSQSFHQMHLFAQANHLYTTLTKFKNFLTGVNSLAEKLSKYTSPVGGDMDAIIPGRWLAKRLQRHERSFFELTDEIIRLVKFRQEEIEKDCHEIENDLKKLSEEKTNIDMLFLELNENHLYSDDQDKSIHMGSFISDHEESCHWLKTRVFKSREFIESISGWPSLMIQISFLQDELSDMQNDITNSKDEGRTELLRLDNLQNQIESLDTQFQYLTQPSQTFLNLIMVDSSTSSIRATIKTLIPKSIKNLRTQIEEYSKNIIASQLGRDKKMIMEMIPAVIKKLHEIDERIEKISEEFNNDHAYKMIPNQQDYLSPMKNSQYLKSNEQLSKPDSVAVSLNTLDIIDIYFGENEVPVLQNLEVQHIFQKWLDKTNSSILEIGHSISEVKDESESIEKAYRSLLKKSETELISIDVEDLTQNGVQIRTLLKKVIKDTLELKTRLKSESSSVSLLFEQLKDLTVKLRSVESGGNLLECETLKSLIVQTDAVNHITVRPAAIMLQNEIDSVDNLIQERRKILNEQRQANVIDRLKVFQRSEIEVMINDMIQQVKVNNDSFIEKTSGIVIEYNTENLIGGSLKVQAPSSIMRHDLEEQNNSLSGKTQSMVQLQEVTKSFESRILLAEKSLETFHDEITKLENNQTILVEYEKVSNRIAEGKQLQSFLTKQNDLVPFIKSWQNVFSAFYVKIEIIIQFLNKLEKSVQDILSNLRFGNITNVNPEQVDTLRTELLDQQTEVVKVAEKLFTALNLLIYEGKFDINPQKCSDSIKLEIGSRLKKLNNLCTEVIDKLDASDFEFKSAQFLQQIKSFLDLGDISDKQLANLQQKIDDVKENHSSERWSFALSEIDKSIAKLKQRKIVVSGFQTFIDNLDSDLLQFRRKSYSEKLISFSVPGGTKEDKIKWIKILININSQTREIKEIQSESVLALETIYDPSDCLNNIAKLERFQKQLANLEIGNISEFEQVEGHSDILGLDILPESEIEQKLIAVHSKTSALIAAHLNHAQNSRDLILFHNDIIQLKAAMNRISINLSNLTTGDLTKSTEDLESSGSSTPTTSPMTVLQESVNEIIILERKLASLNEVGKSLPADFNSEIKHCTLKMTELNALLEQKRVEMSTTRIMEQLTINMNKILYRVNDYKDKLLVAQTTYHSRPLESFLDVEGYITDYQLIEDMSLGRAIKSEMGLQELLLRKLKRKISRSKDSLNLSDNSKLDEQLITLEQTFNKLQELLVSEDERILHFKSILNYINYTRNLQQWLSAANNSLKSWNDYSNEGDTEDQLDHLRRTSKTGSLRLNRKTSRTESGKHSRNESDISPLSTTLPKNLGPHLQSPEAQLESSKPDQSHRFDETNINSSTSEIKDTLSNQIDSTILRHPDHDRRLSDAVKQSPSATRRSSSHRRRASRTNGINLSEIDADLLEKVSTIESKLDEFREMMNKIEKMIPQKLELSIPARDFALSRGLKPDTLIEKYSYWCTEKYESLKASWKKMEESVSEIRSSIEWRNVSNEVRKILTQITAVQHDIASKQLPSMDFRELTFQVRQFMHDGLDSMYITTNLISNYSSEVQLKIIDKLKKRIKKPLSNDIEDLIQEVKSRNIELEKYLSSKGISNLDKILIKLAEINKYDRMAVTFNQIAEQMDKLLEGIAGSVENLNVNTARSYSEFKNIYDSYDNLKTRFDAFEGNTMKLKDMLQELIVHMAEKSPSFVKRFLDLEERWSKIKKLTEKTKSVPILAENIVSNSRIKILRRNLTKPFPTKIPRLIRTIPDYDLISPRSFAAAWAKSNTHISNSMSSLPPSRTNSISSSRPRSRTTSTIAKFEHHFVLNEPLNEYIPDPKDPLDVAVALTVSQCPFSIRVTKDKTPLSDSFDSDKRGAKYWFGDMDENGKAVHCHLRGNNVIVRVGGGWQALSEFLLDHSNLVESAGRFVIFSAPSSNQISPSIDDDV